MRKSLWMALILALFALAAPNPLKADSSTVINFEGLPDSTIVTTQYAGLTFSNAIILTAGVSLNEFAFPPRSGTNVVSDNGGPMSIHFSTPITSFGGYFTYTEPLTIDGFNSVGTLVATAASLFSSNTAVFGEPGSSPNEFIDVTFGGGISAVTITGDPLGGSFTLDDATYTTSSTVPTPEPSSVALMLLGVGLVFVMRKRIAQRLPQAS